MKVICIDDGKIKQSERSFTNCLFQTDKKSSLTYGKKYTILLCKRHGQMITSMLFEETYFIINDKYLNKEEYTWVQLYNDDGILEWYYLKRFITVSEFRNKKLKDLGI